MVFDYQGKTYTLVLLVLSGSRFYNTSYEKGEHPFDKDYVSDYDYKGIFIASQEDKLGLNDYHHEIQPKKDDLEGRKYILSQINEKLGMNIELDEDFALYEVNKFIDMAQNDNPNILDILWSDEDSIFYNTEAGQEVLSHRQSFLSKRIQQSFSKYGLSQMNKMLSHYKMIGKYPQVTEVADAVKLAYFDEKINYQWIVDNFSGDLASFATGITQEEFNKSKNKKSTKLSWKEFADEYCKDIEDIDKYHRALMVDYVKIKDPKGKEYSVDTKIEDIQIGAFADNAISEQVIDDLKGRGVEEPTLREFLTDTASFRTLGESVYNIFTKPEEKYNGGIFSNNGVIKNNDPKEVGEFVFSLLVKKNEYKAHQDAIKKLWEWKTNRNEKRSVLEEHFGYDTKNAAHLIRLLRSSQKIFKEGVYRPRLEGDNLRVVKDVLNGKYTYDEVISMSKELNQSIEVLVEKSQFQDSVPKEVANNVLLSVLKKFYSSKKQKVQKKSLHQ